SFTAYGVWTAPGSASVALSGDVLSRPAPQNIELAKDEPSESSLKRDGAASQPANDASDATDRSSQQHDSVSTSRQNPAAHVSSGARPGRIASFTPGATLSARNLLAAAPSADNRAFIGQVLASAPAGQTAGAQAGGAASFMAAGGGYGGRAAVSGGAA